MKPRLATAVAAIAFVTGCNSSAPVLPRSNPAPVLARTHAVQGAPSYVTVSVGRFAGAISVAVDRSANIYVAYSVHPVKGCVSGNNCGTQAQGVDKITPSGNVVPVARKQLAGAQYVSVDRSGNLYVSCLTSGNTGVVKKVARNGGVTNLGSFDQPYGVGADDAGNVYVADQGARQVYKLPPHGSRTTIAPGTFADPEGLAVDSRGNLYVTDAGTSLVSEVYANGSIRTVGGGFINPVAVSLHNDTVFVADSQLNAIEEVSPGGAIASIGAGFYAPYGVAVAADGTVYVADGGNNALKKVETRGTLNFVGYGLNRSSGVAIDANKAVYVADTGNSDVRQIVLPSTASSPIHRIAGGVHPVGVAIDEAANVYVADTAFGTIRKYAPGGSASDPTWKLKPALGHGFKEPSGIAIWYAKQGKTDPHFVSIGAFLVADTGNNSVKRIDKTCPAGCAIGSGAKFNLPQGVAVDSTGNVYVADTGNSEIKKVAGQSIEIIGGPDYRPYYPSGVAVDSSGDVFVADTGNNTVEMLTRRGKQWSVAALGSGFNEPRGVTVTQTASGYDVYIADLVGIWVFSLPRAT